MSEHDRFREDCASEIRLMARSSDLVGMSRRWMDTANLHKYSYHFTWMGRPIIQYPQDIVALQEIIWEVRPDLILETGVAHGGSLVLSASMLALLDMQDAIREGTSLDPVSSGRRVIGIDIDIRDHNRAAIEAHPMSSRIELIQGSSISVEVVHRVTEIAKRFQRVLVLLDSNHSHEHVLNELLAYAPLVSVGSYCVVFDTVIEEMPEGTFLDRPWGPGNNPKTAVYEFVRRHANFEIDRTLTDKLQITVAPDGYLRRVG